MAIDRQPGGQRREGDAVSDIGPILTVGDLIGMALLAGAPGAVIGALIGAYVWPASRAVSAVLCGFAGFVLCLGGVIAVLFVTSN